MLMTVILCSSQVQLIIRRLLMYTSCANNETFIIPSILFFSFFYCREMLFCVGFEMEQLLWLMCGRNNHGLQRFHPDILEHQALKEQIMHLQLGMTRGLNKGLRYSKQEVCKFDVSSTINGLHRVNSLLVLFKEGKMHLEHRKLCAAESKGLLKSKNMLQQ